MVNEDLPEIDFVEKSSLEQVLVWMNSPFVHIGQTPVTLGGLAGALLVILGALAVSWLLQRMLVERLARKFGLTSGMAYAFRRFFHYGILIAGVILAAQCVGLNFGSLALVFGFLGVGIGFGLQNVTSNFIAGLILLVERPVSVGDLVRVDDQVGRVTQINMRSTLILTMDRVSVVIPNSRFIESQVVNWSHTDPTVRVHCPVGVAYGSDLDQVRAVLHQVAAGREEVLKQPPPEVRFLAFGDSSLNLELLVWTKAPEQQFKLQSDINFAVEAAFRDAGIQIPFPQRDLHLKMTPAIERLGGSGT